MQRTVSAASASASEQLFPAPRVVETLLSPTRSPVLSYTPTSMAPRDEAQDLTPPTATPKVPNLTLQSTGAADTADTAISAVTFRQTKGEGKGKVALKSPTPLPTNVVPPPPRPAQSCNESFI